MAKATLHDHPAAIPPMPAVARILSQFDRPKLEGFITVALGLLDVLDGDPDTEDNGDAEAVGDEEDIAWPEWHTRGRHKDLPPRSLPHEDAEDDDASEEDDGDSAVDDRPCDDINMDLEPDHDAELQTWAHPDDHPAELFVGKRSGASDGPEAA
jgi:hypothetical protein